MSRAAGSNGRLTHEDIDQMSSSDDEEPPPLVGSPESSEDEAPAPPPLENGHNFFSLHTRISVYIICLYHIFYISRPAGSNFIYPKENEEPPPLVDHGTSLYPVFQPVSHTFEDLARWARGPLLAKSFLPVGHTHEIDSEFLLRVPNGLYLSSL